MKKALTMTVIFQANSLNYGEGIANISELKKFHRGDGEVYTYASRQSIRYDIVRLGNELFGWNLDTVDKASGVVQFKKDVTINDSVEMDLFGYLKTDKNSQKRPAVVRLSHAISLEPYKSDLEFLNNMGLASRIGQDANLANIEQHHSFYTYTITIDLNRVGVDGEIELPSEEKANRVLQLLEVLKVLNRNIRGRQENLSPLFVIGGMYNVANPFFLGRVQLSVTGNGWAIQTKPIKETMEQTFAGEAIGKDTRIGILSGVFANEGELYDLFNEQVMPVEPFFQYVSKQIKAYYGV
ncbi:CRISPR-associated protein DevR [Anoxybacillus gonensis]|uniref:Type I-B CRISPR-associated protein Cas7/Cst2/DevR n=1 Tax=Anoxybacillus gonensis TaxID=198467 RepID=A0AAW7TDJ0_9BACL|nr:MULTISPECIES: type I-B CRISPR-associated protein Cas7/Cst2/DevR [Anoxybacillus]AXM89700.1 type I-B CRISPR-associated protein Cas7/Cst2/DevR [Anoxybacillus ayderensis G10]THD16503.1 type I-B CRISPR-associated protein Cas7/Cst2/DevR [Anoxybacillus ayderensis]AKS39005.1 CRISPR-associated protein DevR [Anoxybacillus gonensis]EMI10505.1 CRISPR system-like protein [Anoxybacillus gonensis]KGP59894.1 CRISPR-associated protein DevR [Anoxybacillus gonensis]